MSSRPRAQTRRRRVRLDDAIAARRAARRLYASEAFVSAFLRGWKARRAERPAEDCPYPARPRTGWRRVYRTAWLRGWDAGE